MDPLMFFYERRIEWPRLYEFAKQIFVIQASNTGTERGFSAETLVVTKIRTRLNGDNINDIILANFQRKNEKAKMIAMKQKSN